jgi:putative membrane protein
MQYLSGPLSAHMAQHIVLMNVLAPLLAIAMARRLPNAARPGLALATVLQLVLLWGWHAPPVMGMAIQSLPLHLTMQVTLLTAATWFWFAIVRTGGTGSWRAIVALLVTSKIFCLLAVLMVFAPRALYGFAGSHYLHASAAAGTLDDQQLAGLLMLVACPATYVLGGIIIAARWFAALERGSASIARRAVDA